ncbi:adenylyltransferase and sulfurtransferase [Arachidicoccus rhizosphaerae]|uniref:Adenylyltransferase and sulfurtransferase n=1 Tax=Arachidicoccus rhizosphaerae TaxID=551991 RepID=A0A1H3ZGB9_9BACT|nr:HesA/MoeB/ThiF family protein [Arachidicoccus rhizosphaerae]SEA22793.1 adenylyltransferase and sulfurtransferase [Arachidicoccus rhizosphaerae]
MADTPGRYHCQMALPGFGMKGQQSLHRARVLIVGAGGLGCPVGQYLAAAGIGQLAIADDDTVSLSNLHRQILFTPADIGKPKALVAAERLQAQNPDIAVIAINERVHAGNILRLLEDFDLVVDGSDNFETKYLLSDACVLAHKPLIYGAIYRYEGQVAVLNVPLQDGTYAANYRDIFPDANKAAVPDCSEGGVLPPLAGIVGCLQASEVIKYFTDKAALLTGKLCMINLKDGSIYQIKLTRNPDIQIKDLSQHLYIESIGYEELKNGDYQLVDVRSFKEHLAFNIGGALLPLNTFADHLPALMDTIGISRPIVCYCETGKRSREGALLIKKYYPQATIYTLRNGISPLKEKTEQ